METQGKWYTVYRIIYTQYRYSVVGNIKYMLLTIKRMPRWATVVHNNVSWLSCMPPVFRFRSEITALGVNCCKFLYIYPFHHSISPLNRWPKSRSKLNHEFSGEWPIPISNRWGLWWRWGLKRRWCLSKQTVTELWHFWTETIKILPKFCCWNIVTCH